MEAVRDWDLLLLFWGFVLALPLATMLVFMQSKCSLASDGLDCLVVNGAFFSPKGLGACYASSDSG